VRKPRIYIDGFNLSLEQGTGVATYSRNLSFALRDLGAEVGVLYGTSVSTISFQSLIREIAFFDPRVGKPSWLTEKLLNLWRTLTLPFGEIATQVPITGRVIRDTFRARLPYFDHIWNIQGLYSKQELYGKFFGRRMMVHFRQAPHIMHWTYPLALRVSNAKNIYTLHDLVPLRLPYTTLDNKRYYFRLTNRRGVKKGHHQPVWYPGTSDYQYLSGRGYSGAIPRQADQRCQKRCRRHFWAYLQEVFSFLWRH
jgi:hypothetical protein